MTDLLIGMAAALGLGLVVSGAVTKLAGMLLRVGSVLLLLWLLARQTGTHSLGGVLQAADHIRWQVLDWFVNHSKAAEGIGALLRGGR